MLLAWMNEYTEAKEEKTEHESHGNNSDEVYILATRLEIKVFMVELFQGVCVESGAQLTVVGIIQPEA